MESRFDKVDAKLEVIDTRLDTIDKILIRQEANLDLHMKRSELLEEMVSLMKQEMKPIEKHVSMVEGAFKILGFLVLIAGTIAALMPLFK